MPYYRGVPSPDWYSLARGPLWNAVALKSPTNSDYNLWLESTSGYTSTLTTSFYGTGNIDYVLIDGNRNPAPNYYPAVTQGSGTGGYEIEQATHTADINGFGTYGPYVMPATDIVRIWDTYLITGTTYYFRIRPQSGNASLTMALHKSDGAIPSTWYQSRSNAVATASSAGPGDAVYLKYTATTTDWYGLVVLNNGATVATPYYIDLAGARLPAAYVPNVMQHYTPPCDAYDPNETDLTRYGPLLSGVNYNAKLCQNDIDKYYFNAPSAGTVHVSITIPPSLINTASIAFYNPAAINNNSICSYVPLTQATTTFTCPLATAGQYRINLYSTNNLIYYDNNNYYTLNITYP